MSVNHAKERNIVQRSMVLITLIVMVGILNSCSFFKLSAPEPTIVPTPTDSGKVTVIIKNEELADFLNVVVRVLDSPMVDTKADDGKLILLTCMEGQKVTAWASGYYIATQPCHTGQGVYEFTLTPYHVNDNAYYTWVEARNAGQSRSCAPCHDDEEGRLEFTEWIKDGHSTVFTDNYFWTMYLGMDVYWNRNPDTRWVVTDNSTHARIVPDHSIPYYGPGFKTDYPADNGSCAFCHAPASVSGPQTEVDLTQWIYASHAGQSSAATEGINCDVCHKVLNVRLGPDSMPLPDKPGVLSFDFVREEPNSKRLYVGSRPGTDTEETLGESSVDSQINVTCSHIFSRSEFCAPCHYGKFWGTQIYNSYGEWKESPYSKDDDAENYKTCQACHMTVNNGTPAGDTNVKTTQRQACSEQNVIYEDFSHNMMQRQDGVFSALIKEAAKINLEAKKVDERIEVVVYVKNTQAGHKFPTDSPLRHLILHVDVRDQSNTLLPQLDGPRIPVWGGVGNQEVDYSGRPGEIYANILMDLDTNQVPAVAYWNPTRAAWTGSDTRLKPNDRRDSKYIFSMPATGHAVIKVKLIYRYAFIEIARLKGWTQPDIEVASVECRIVRSHPDQWTCSASSP